MTPSLRCLPRALAALIACGALAAPAIAFAQDAKPAAPAKPAATAPAAGAPAAKAPAAKGPACAPGTQDANGKPCPRGSAAARARNIPPPTTPEQMAALEPADDEQKAASQLVHYGKYVCDDKYEVFIERNGKQEGYVDVRYQKDIWVMKPVASKTGAVRLEDIRGRVLLVQIPFKSMLLNTQTGQRIVDSCQHDVQKGAEKEARDAPAGTSTTSAILAPNATPSK